MPARREPSEPLDAILATLSGMWRGGFRRIGISVLALVGAFAVGGIMVWLSGQNPYEAYRYLVVGSLGSVSAIAETLSKAAPLLVIALGVAIAFRARIFNVGAEGQLLIGGLAGAVVGAALHAPGWLSVPLLLLVAGVGGALWASITGVLKAYLNTNEVISTLMLNFIAVFLVNYLVSGPLRDPLGGAEPTTRVIVESSRLPLIMSSTRLHIGILIGVVLVPVVHKYMSGTAWGLHLRSIGDNSVAASRLGVSVTGQIMAVMIISGMLAGIAGYFEVGGRHYRMITGIGGSLGFTAIVIALLGRLHPLGVLIAVFVFSALEVGASAMAQFAGVPAALVRVLEALIVLFVIVGDSWAKRIQTA